MMFVAVPSENDEIIRHFGKAKMFTVFETYGGSILSINYIFTDDILHNSAVRLFFRDNVSAVICDNIDEFTRKCLEELGIEYYSGITGKADAAVQAYLVGRIRGTERSLSATATL